METVWFVSLIGAICLEGLGRRYLPSIPSAAFYFFKDVVLLFGYLRFRPTRPVQRTARYLYRGFEVFFFAGIGWTIIEIFNPDQQSKLLGLVGMRAYWLWWLAPVVIANVLLRRKQKDRAIYALSILGIGIAALAAVQFVSPADSTINLYSSQDGEEVYAADLATVASTGRARVSSTFTFLSGFVDFTLTIPALLLSLGLDSQNPRVRWFALVGTLATTAAIPMSGSRGAVVVAGAILVITMWSAGLFFTRMGRRVLIGSLIAGVLSVIAFPEAMLGVQSRFGNEEETASRFQEIASAIPLVALFEFDYPAFGIGTGMQQNSKTSLHIYTAWDAEGELARYLVELGPVGFALIWTAKLGLMIALLRCYSILKQAGRRGSASAALSYAALTMFGNLAFDHNWQALYFVGCGFILAEVVAVLRERGSMPGAVERETAPQLLAGQQAP